MKWFIPLLILTIVAVIGSYTSYQAGMSYVKRNIVVQWFPLGQQYKFYGSCQSEVYFDNVRGVACARIEERK